MEKVTTVRDPEIEARGFDKMRSIVEVDLTDGRTLVQEADERYRGGPGSPSPARSCTRSSPTARRWCCGRPAITETLDGSNRSRRCDDVGEPGELARVRRARQRPIG